MTAILALDQGTTSSRAMVFNDDGAIIGSAQQEFTQHYPAPGLVEHNAEEIWETQLATAREAIRRAKLHPRDIAAIGITNQRETTVLWDRRTARPVGRAIVWQDRRTASICAQLRAAGAEQVVRERTGLVLDPYFSATKIKWMLDRDPALRMRAERGEICFGTIDSWLLYKLTSGQAHATDVTNAARTLLFNIHSLDWDEDLLEVFNIPRALLPEVRPSAHRFAETDRTHIGSSLLISGIAGDQQAALFGQACFEPGMAKNTYGTGSFIVMNIGDARQSAFGNGQSIAHCRLPIAEGVLTTVAWQIANEPAQYALEASVFITGAAVQWLRDGLGLIQTSAEVEDLASSVSDNGGVYFVPALTGLGAPHWDPSARGLIIGLTRGTTKAHIARATLEAMAYQTRDGIEAMRMASGIELAELRADGGAAVDDLLMQFQADILNTPVLRPKITETTALGAANLAAIGAGLRTQHDLAERWQLDRRFEPTMTPSDRDSLYDDWRRAVERARAWAIEK